MSAVTRSTDRPALRRLAPLGEAGMSAGVISRFRQVVEARPDALAACDDEHQLSFAQVAAEAARVLRLIRASADQVREPVALLHEHTAPAVSALLAILASGHPVLVLDARTPAPRLRTLIERVDVRFCLSDAANLATAGGLVELAAQVPQVAGDGSAQALAAAQPLWANPPEPTQAAVMAFTSGSTGRPKVVLNDHQLLARDAWTNSLGTGCYDQDDVVAHTLPMGFHAGLMATVAGLLVGCPMQLYDVRGAGIGGLAPWLERVGASVLQASPGILRALVAARPQPRQLARLRAITVAGEALYRSDVAAARALLPPGCAVHNRYGSSETGLIADYRVPDLPDLAGAGPDAFGALPVGPGPGDTEITVVDDDGRPLPAGQPGRVVVTAGKTAIGYWQDDAATAAAFSHAGARCRYLTSDVGRLDAQGRLTLLGRRDHSVKIRGYLVEPGEVDAALFALDDVREAVVVGCPRPEDGSSRLVAYVVSRSPRPSGVAVRAALHASLPGHMVPETVVFLDALPRTDRGKLDRSALPPPPPVLPGRGASGMTEWERVVAGVWERVLSLDVVGRDDDFFELGGDSLAAEQLMAALVGDLGVPAAGAGTTLLAQAPTLGEFARRLTRTPERRRQSVIPLRTAGSQPPLFLVAGAGGLGVGLLPLVKYLPPDRPAYALQAHALERRGIPDWSVQAAARRHVRSIRELQPHGPYHLGGHSFGGVVALEIAQQLSRAGETVELLVILDSFPPAPHLLPRLPPRSIARRLRDRIGLLGTGVLPTPGLGQYWRFHRQGMLLSRWYRCPPWPGRTLVVVADSPERELRSSWAPHLSGDWEMISIGGDHLAMMREPWVALIGSAVSAALAAGRPSPY